MTITPNMTLINNANAVGSWSSIGGGAGAADEPDFKYEGSQCISRAVSASRKGMTADYGSGIDLSTGSAHIYMWMQTSAPGTLDTEAGVTAPGMVVRLASGTTNGSNYGEYRVKGSDTYPPVGGWILVILNPRDLPTATGSSGTLAVSGIRHYGGQIQTTVSVKGQNYGIDIISYGTGLTCYGSGQSYGSFVTYDYGTIASPGIRWGVIRPLFSGGYQVAGRLTLGTTANSVTFDDDAKILIFYAPHGDLRVASNFNGITIAANSGSVVTLGANGANTYLAENRTAAPFDFIVDGAGTVNVYGDIFDGFRIMTLRSGVLFSGVSAKNGGQITQNGATLTDCQFEDFTGGSGNPYIMADDIDLISGCNFVQGAGGHAIRCDTPGTYDWIGITDTGYTGTRGSNLTESSGSNDAMFYNNSSGLITLSVSGGQSPSVRNGAGATTVVNNTVSVQVVVSDENSDPIEAAHVFLEAASGGPMPDHETVSISRSGSTATVAHTGHGMASGEKICIRGAAQWEYNGVWVITVTDADHYTYTVTGTPTTPATGTITATGVIVNDFTDANGLAENNGFNFSDDQPVAGWVRKSSSSPYFASASIGGTIQGDFAANVIMVRDE